MRTNRTASIVIAGLLTLFTLTPTQYSDASPVTGACGNLVTKFRYKQDSVTGITSATTIDTFSVVQSKKGCLVFTVTLQHWVTANDANIQLSLTVDDQAGMPGSTWTNYVNDNHFRSSTVLFVFNAVTAGTHSIKLIASSSTANTINVDDIAIVINHT